MGDGNDTRPAESWRVRRFYRLTPEEIGDRLVDGPGKEEAIALLGRIASGSDGPDPSRIDGWETGSAASVFLADPPARGDKTFPHLLRHPIFQRDITLFWREAAREEVERDRSEVAREYGIDRVRHPFAQLFRRLSATELDKLRGLPAFDKLADRLPRVVPGIAERRDLEVLYPGSGAHLAPLLTALRLIDGDVIDHARFVFTEIEVYHLADIASILREGVEAGLFERRLVETPRHFDDGGSERTIRLLYRKKPIEIVFALNRSGKEYYRDDYLKTADLVVIHDPLKGGIQASYDMLAGMLKKRGQSGPSGKNQAVIMEKGYKGKSDFHPLDPICTVDLPVETITLPGPYGHCAPREGVGEAYGCFYDRAILVHLDDPKLMEFASRYGDASELGRKLCREIDNRPAVMPQPSK